MDERTKELLEAAKEAMSGLRAIAPAGITYGPRDRLQSAIDGMEEEEPSGLDLKASQFGIYNENDGHTYYIVEGEWWGAPTFKDGSPDLTCTGPIADFDLARESIKILAEALYAFREAQPDVAPQPHRLKVGERVWHREEGKGHHCNPV